MHTVERKEMDEVSHGSQMMIQRTQSREVYQALKKPVRP